MHKAFDIVDKSKILQIAQYPSLEDELNKLWYKHTIQYQTALQSGKLGFSLLGGCWHGEAVGKLTRGGAS